MIDDESSDTLEEMRIEMSEMRQELTLIIEQAGEDQNIEMSAIEDRCTAIELRIRQVEKTLNALVERLDTLESTPITVSDNPELERRMAMMEKTLIYIYKASKVKNEPK